MILYDIDWIILDGVDYPGWNVVESTNMLLIT